MRNSSFSLATRGVLLTLIAVGWQTGVSGVASAATLSNNLTATTEYTELVSDNNWIASAFKTDSSPYVLFSVTALILRDSSGPLAMSLYTGGSAGPGALLGTLITPSSISSSGLTREVFAGNGLALSAATTYWIVLTAAGSSMYEWAYAADNSGSGPGFVHSWASSTDAGSSWLVSDLQPMQMKVDAHPSVPSIPEPATCALLVFGLSALAAGGNRRSSR